MLINLRDICAIAEQGNMGMGVDTTSQVGASVLFFCYDTVKIAILLVAVIFIIGYIQSYFPPERTKKLLGHLHVCDISFYS